MIEFSNHNSYGKISVSLLRHYKIKVQGIDYDVTKVSFFKKVRFLSLIVTLFIIAPPVFAATSPGLGQADSFSILSSSYVNTAPGTTLNGDLGYTTGPVVPATVNGTTHVADVVYNQAGIDQGTALTNLNNQPCTFSFAPGAIDLGTDTTHGTAGLYVPGVYCITGAASIGGGSTITLNGGGTYIFRMTGALDTSANSVVTLAGGASSCDIWWTPGAATTLGANSTFHGTDIDASGITIGSTVTWTGRALAFGGTVSTSVDTINTIPACSATSNTDTTMPSSGSGAATGSGTTASDAANLAGTGQNSAAILLASFGLILVSGALFKRKFTI